MSAKMTSLSVEALKLVMDSPARGSPIARADRHQISFETSTRRRIPQISIPFFASLFFPFHHDGRKHRHRWKSVGARIEAYNRRERRKENPELLCVELTARKSRTREQKKFLRHDTSTKCASARTHIHICICICRHRHGFPSVEVLLAFISSRSSRFCPEEKKNLVQTRDAKSFLYPSLRCPQHLSLSLYRFWLRRLFTDPSQGYRYKSRVALLANDPPGGSLKSPRKSFEGFRRYVPHIKRCGFESESVLHVWSWE